MKNKIQMAAVLFLAAAWLTACKKHDDPPPPKHTIQPDVSSKELGWLAGSKDSFNVKSDVPFTVSIPADAAGWLSASAPDAYGKIVLNALTTDSIAPRATEITLSAPGNPAVLPVKVAVHQHSTTFKSSMMNDLAPAKLLSVVSLQDGSYVVMGSSIAPTIGSIQNHGRSDVFVRKFNAAGETVWSNYLGGSQMETPYQMIATSDGGFAIVGTTVSTDGDFNQVVPPTSTGSNFLFIMKLHSDGSLQRVNFYGSSSLSNLLKIAETRNGGFVIAGSTIALDGQLTPPPGWHPSQLTCFLLATDANGAFSWSKLLGSASTTDVTDVSTLNVGDNGDIVMTGQFRGNADQTFAGTTPHGNFDIFVIRVTAAGGLISSKVYGGSGYEYSNAVTMASNGDLLVAATYSVGDGDFAGGSGVSMALLKITTDGAMSVLKSWPAPNAPRPNAMARTPDGGIIIGGWNNGGFFGTDITALQGNENAVLIRLKPDYSIQWVRIIGGQGDDYGYSLVVRPDGGILMAGSTQSSDSDFTTWTGSIYPLLVNIREQ